MKKKFLKTSFYIVLATMLGLTAAFALRSERAAAQADSPGGKLEGTWRADVTVTNCAGVPIDLPKSDHIHFSNDTQR